MPHRIKLPYRLALILSIVISLFIFLNYGWSTYALITDRSGLAGNIYIYYQLDKFQFITYTSIVSLIGLLIILFQIQAFANQKLKTLTMSFYVFFTFILVLLICEMYLQTRFIGKA